MLFPINTMMNEGELTDQGAIATLNIDFGGDKPA
jgi:hypothetical protein